MEHFDSVVEKKMQIINGVSQNSISEILHEGVWNAQRAGNHHLVRQSDKLISYHSLTSSLSYCKSQVCEIA